MALPQKIIDEMRERRRDFHKYPETGWTEFRTTAKIAAALRGLGWKTVLSRKFIDPDEAMGRPENIEEERKRALKDGADPALIREMGGYTGLTASIDTGRAGPVTVFRFDIDCVDVEEASDEGHRPAREGFASVKPGRMHACGHDGHAAIGLALAELLVSERERLRGRLRLVFQPAEEGVRGGYAMMMAGVVNDADYFIAMHLGLGAPTGYVAGGIGGFLCSTKFDAEFTGVAAHAGGEPERGRNALLAAANAAINLHAIPPHSGGATRVNVGVLNAGEGRNVIPPHASMKIETRGENSEIASWVYSKATDVVYGAARMYDVDVRISKQGETITAESNEALARIVTEEAAQIPAVSQIDLNRKMAGSDDACWYMGKVQERGGLATYIQIGADTPAGHHNGRFDFDEAAMAIAAELLERIAFKLNAKK